MKQLLNSMHAIIKDIEKELKKYVDPVYREGSQKFFKEEMVNLGVRVGTVRKIGRELYKQIKTKSKKEVFGLAEELLQQPYEEFATIAFMWIDARKKEFTASDFSFFKKVVEKYVTNWARCDGFCTHSVGTLLMMYPELVEKIKPWTKSKNRWMRRASAVSFIYPAKKKLFINDIFEIAERLLTDKDDMVQKGYGWMLKDASVTVPGKVSAFVMKHKRVMPRTALRYAIERFTPETKKELMKL